MADTFSCITEDSTPATNCTASEIVPQQWGESYLTYWTPLYTPGKDKTFIPKAYSLYNWGGVSVPRVYAPPELNAYSEPPYYDFWDRKYSEQQIEYITSEDYSWYGTGNIYNNMRMWAEYKDYSETGVPPDRKTSYFWSMQRFTGLGYRDMSRIMYAYSWMVTYFALGGITKQYRIEDLVKGYNSD